nr:MAG TPA: hypothetical protein [Crassvirales sp.]
MLFQILMDAAVIIMDILPVVVVVPVNNIRLWQ